MTIDHFVGIDNLDPVNIDESYYLIPVGLTMTPFYLLVIITSLNIKSFLGKEPAIRLISMNVSFALSL